jgi:hypothetical protein
MGLFYSNMTVYRPLQPRIAAALRKFERDAFISPTVDGHTVIFDQEIESQAPDVIEQLGIELTRELNCSALSAVLHDDDVLYLWLFENGRTRDRYDSLPQYFDADAEPGPPEGGNSELLCRAFDRTDRREKVERLLRANLLEDKLPVVAGELERHQALAVELGLPSFVAGLTFSSIAGQYHPDEFREITFDRIPTA